MNIKFYKILLFILIFSSCKDKTTHSINEKNRILTEFGQHLSSKDKVSIVRNILSTKNISKYLHLELEERKPIRLIKDKFLSNMDSFTLNSDTDVVIVDSVPKLRTNLLLKISLNPGNIEKGTFVFFSPIENAEVNGSLVFKDSIWSVEVISDIEF